MDSTRSYIYPSASQESIALSQQGHLADIAETEIFRVAGSMTPEMATKLVAGIVDAIKSVTIGITARLPATASHMTEASVGRSIYEGVKSSIAHGGEALRAVINADFDISAFVNSLTTKPALDRDEEEIMSDPEDTPIEMTSLPYYERQAKLQKASKIAELRATNARDIQDREQRIRALQEEIDKLQGVTTHTGTPTTRRASQRQAEGGTPVQDARLRERQVELLRQRESLRLLEQAITENEHQAVRERIDMYWDKQFCDATDAYQTYRQKVSLYKSQKKRKQTQVNTNLAIMTFANGLHQCITLIVTKVKNCVNNHPAIKAKLSGTAILPSGRVLRDPYNVGNGNLTGILSILQKTYSSPDLVVFCNMLLQLLSISVSEADARAEPGCGINLVNHELTAWEQMGLFSYLNKDRLFTIIALNTYPAHSFIRRNAITRLLDFLDKQPAENNLGDDTNEDMPLFRHLEHYIKEYTRTGIPCVGVEGLHQ